MDYPLIINDIVRLGAHPSDFLHRDKNLILNLSEDRFEFVLSLAEEAGLLSTVGKGWRKGENFTELIEGKVGKYYNQLISVFLNSQRWDELPHIIRLKAMGEREAPNKARTFLFSSLREGERRAAFIRRIREENPNFYRKGGIWKLRRERKKPLWDELETKLIDLFLKELEWLNVIKNDENIEFSSLGKEIMNGREPEFQFEKPLVKPDYEVVAGFAIHPKSLYFLETIAEPVSCDGIYIYRISKETITNIIEKGMNPKEILKILKSWGAPDNLKENIKIWGARFSKIKLRFGGIIEFEDPYLMKEILGIEGIKDIIKPIDEKYGLITIDNLEKLKKHLKAENYYAEIPKSWKVKKILYLSEEEKEVLKGILSKLSPELNFPFNVVIEEILERL